MHLLRDRPETEHAFIILSFQPTIQMVIGCDQYEFIKIRLGKGCQINLIFPGSGRHDSHLYPLVGLTSLELVVAGGINSHLGLF